MTWLIQSIEQDAELGQRVVDLHGVLVGVVLVGTCTSGGKVSAPRERARMQKCLAELWKEEAFCSRLETVFFRHNGLAMIKTLKIATRAVPDTHFEAGYWISDF